MNVPDVMLRPSYSATGLGYRAVDVLRNSGRPMPLGGSGDYHLRPDLLTLRRESQRLDRDNGLYRGLVNRSLDNILGDGFTLHATTPNKRLNERLESLWDEWCQAPEIRGMDSWWQIERMVLRHLQVDGDIGGLKASNGQVQLVEAEQIGGLSITTQTINGSRIMNGVEMDFAGRPTAYHLYEYSPTGQITGNNSRRIPAESFIFLAYRDRTSQTRGVPAQVSNFPMFHRINDVCDSEAIAWQLLSRFALVVNRSDAALLASATSEDPGDSTDARNVAKRNQDYTDAIIFNGEIGETVTAVDRDLPGANFPNSLTMFIRLLGLPLGLPLELMLLDWSKTNYSSARAALEQAFRMFQCWQRLLKERWHGPIYRWKVLHWIAQGLIPAAKDITSHDWITPSFPWIDQLKEAEAWGMRVDRGLSTYTEALKSQNRDRDNVMALRKREVIEAIETADAINTQMKLPPDRVVPWEIFAGMAPPAPSVKPQPIADGASANGVT